MTDYLISYTAETMIGFTSGSLGLMGYYKVFIYLKEWNGLKHYFFFAFFLFKTGTLNQVVKVKWHWLRLWRKIQIEMLDSMSGQSMSIKVVFYLQEGYLLLDVGCYFVLVRNLKIPLGIYIMIVLWLDNFK